MRLDPATLLLACFVTTFLVGTMFVLSWSQARTSRALAIWGVAHLTGSLASGGLALRGIIPDILSIGLANAVMLAAYGLIWSGMRAFEGRPLRLPLALAGGLVWALLCCVPAFYGSQTARVIVASTLAGAYCTAASVEVWRGRAEVLVSRYPATVLLATYAGFYFVRIPMAVLAPPAPGADPLASPWLSVLCLAGMLFTLAIAFTFMALTKERAERVQRIAASTDPLTGAANRRAFVAGAEALLQAGGPAAMLVFDLDNFKAINDTYGHAVGDGVLVGFCSLATTLLPPGTVLGRLGGEEFACLLSDRTPEAARAQAERIRGAFATLAIPELPHLRLSVSVGIAASRAYRGDFDGLMRDADAALYRAKRNGRDRIELAEPAARRAA
ncbi:diguanylate cyclase domain-containing protein [Methylobacterium trifolii]